jgi:DNA-binding CsgD family transcriptional regulator
MPNRLDDSHRLLHLIELVYAAPGAMEGWQQFLSALCKTVDGTAASFISHDLSASTGNVAVAVGADAAALESYTRHWIHEDPWAYSPKARSLSPGSVVVGSALIPRAALKRTAFYNEFSRHIDVGQSIVSVVESDSRRLSGFSINGSDRREEFGRTEVGLLRELMPHLQQALTLHRRLVSAENALQSRDRALHALCHAAALTDGHGLIRQVNAEGEAILNARDGLYLDRGRLRAAHANDTAQLRRLIGAAALTQGGGGLSSGGRLLLGRPSGRRPLRVLVALAPGLPDGFRTGESCAIVFVIDPDRRRLPSEGELRDLFGLTRAESRLVLALANGLTLAQTARSLQQSPATLRSYLKVVFNKTDTHRQSDLIQLVREWPAV